MNKYIECWLLYLIVLFKSRKIKWLASIDSQSCFGFFWYKRQFKALLCEGKSTFLNKNKYPKHKLWHYPFISTYLYTRRPLLFTLITSLICLIIPSVYYFNNLYSLIFVLIIVLPSYFILGNIATRQNYQLLGIFLLMILIFLLSNNIYFLFSLFLALIIPFISPTASLNFLGISIIFLVSFIIGNQSINITNSHMIPFIIVLISFLFKASPILSSKNPIDEFKKIIYAIAIPSNKKSSKQVCDFKDRLKSYFKLLRGLLSKSTLVNIFECLYLLYLVNSSNNINYNLLLITPLFFLLLKILYSLKVRYMDYENIESCYVFSYIYALLGTSNPFNILVLILSLYPISFKTYGFKFIPDLKQKHIDKILLSYIQIKNFLLNINDKLNLNAESENTLVFQSNFNNNQNPRFHYASFPPLDLLLYLNEEINYSNTIIPDNYSLISSEREFRNNSSVYNDISKELIETIITKNKVCYLISTSNRNPFKTSLYDIQILSKSDEIYSPMPASSEFKKVHLYLIKLSQ